MSSINEVMEEEKTAQRILREAEEKADRVVREARAAAGEMLGKAQADEAILKELGERQKEKTEAERAQILGDCMVKVEETENLCRMNFEAAVSLIVQSVLGEGT